ncbi:4008_t:CDS:2 [Paraglomus brasilianum]|uniref:4008_t:CDS:1 n=1 Tax=Paraglomus brasilianum TaxID=144538 RepID=A0A9N9BY16_9GLOM|nr:4008_t:CDS:2 [Paraglomus brasilianum]
MADIQEAKKFVELLIARFHKSCDTIDRDVEEWYNDQRQDDVAYFNLISTHPSLEHREIALATLYKHGFGTSQSTAKAVELYEKASQSGDVYGDCELARYYREKEDGEDSAKRALEYAKKAADGNVAELFIEKALLWYGIAADKGNVQARIRLDEYSKIMAKW